MRRRQVGGNLRGVGRGSLGSQRGRQKQGCCAKHSADQAPERSRNNHKWLPPWAAVRRPFESAQNGLFTVIPQGEGKPRCPRSTKRIAVWRDRGRAAGTTLTLFRSFRRRRPPAAPT